MSEELSQHVNLERVIPEVIAIIERLISLEHSKTPCEVLAVSAERLTPCYLRLPWHPNHDSRREH